VPIAIKHVEGFHRALDRARERKYLSVFEAFSVQAMRDFVQNPTNDGPAFVAHRADEVIRWCYIRRHGLPAFDAPSRLSRGADHWRFRRR
jgi:hypothetical protein